MFILPLQHRSLCMYMYACSLLSKDQLLANISKSCLNSPRIKHGALGAWLGGENGMGLWWKYGLRHGNLQDHFVQSFLVDICCFAHSASFLCLSGRRSPISYGELISCDLNGADPAPISQEWVLTHAWPIRGLHLLIHSDWFRAGHKTQARPVRVIPGKFILELWVHWGDYTLYTVSSW